MAVQGSSLPSPGVPREVDAVVVGAGFAGLYMLLLLRDELQLDVVGLEAASGVGGVWYWNRYPGARCDIASCDYSYSFSAALQQEWRWPEKYPAQPDILAYLEHVASRFDLARSFRFDAKGDRTDNPYRLFRFDGAAFVEVKWRQRDSDLDLALDDYRLRRVRAAVEAAAHRYAKPGDEVRIDAVLLAPGRFPRHMANALIA